jgi:hypothetical protein
MKYEFTNTNTSTDNIDPGEGKFVFSQTIGFFKTGEIVTLSGGGVFKITKVLSCGNHFKTKNMNKRQLKKFNKNHNGCYKLFLEKINIEEDK